MYRIIDWLKAFFMAAATFCSAMIGDCMPLLLALCALMVIDYITGIMAAIITKTLSSRIGAAGIIKKCCYLAVIATACAIDMSVMGDKMIIRPMIISFFLANEGLSVVENAARCGVPIPAKLIDTLEQIKEGGKNEN